MGTSYKKGRRFEQYIKEKLVKKGYYVVRSASSKGVFDLIAFAPVEERKEILGIQCKFVKSMTKHEKQEIIQTAKRYGLTPVLATRFNNKVILINLETDRLIEGI